MVDVGGHVGRPDLPTDAALAQPRNIGVAIIMAACQVVFQHVALGDLVVPDHPGQVVVAIYQRHLFQELQRAAKSSVPACSWLRHCGPFLPKWRVSMPVAAATDKLP